MLRFLTAFAFVALSLPISAAITGPNAPAASADRQLVHARCTGCHDESVYVGQRRSVDQWAEIIDRMVAHGARISDPEYRRILAHLSRTNGPQPD